ncbi:MAG: hypothetical protein JO329_16740 [Planctomycetaceae bacterium]|nr:hypothetical protein [Planctomycetaceae bacterium]MBV8316111.1 hypothetical protein [Planctomycetaceae bacterium]
MENESWKDERVAVIVLKDTLDYRDWLDEVAEATRLPATTIVRDALHDWAIGRGLRPPPDRSRAARRQARAMRKEATAGGATGPTSTPGPGPPATALEGYRLPLRNPEEGERIRRQVLDRARQGQTQTSIAEALKIGRKRVRAILLAEGGKNGIVGEREP